MNLDLTGKHALVGGGSKGIGLATAQELALLGATVTLAARHEATLRQALATLASAQGQQHRMLIVDYDDRMALKATVDRLVADHPVHILINNTGGPPAGPIHQAAPDAFLAAFERHVLSAQVLTQLCLPGMRAAGYGRIINVISTSVKAPLRGLGVSNTTRGAMANWAKTMANELGAFGITVNNVLPGATATGRLAEIIDNKAARSEQPTAVVTTAMQAGIPLGRFAKPREVGAAAAFLATPAAAYINGINLPVDGGRTPSL